MCQVRLLAWVQKKLNPKNMNIYFSKVTQELSWKNKLDKAICNLLKGHFERRLLNKQELDTALDLVKKEVLDIEKENSRCKPIEFKIRNHARDYCIGTDTITINIYLVH
jgi:hypothetical protein